MKALDTARKKAYYGDRISSNMTKTPEGYLVCHNVPIARTGKQKYLKEEIGVDGTGVVNVMREEKEVFSEAAIASFEGKPVTNDHPDEDVTANNYDIYSKGHTSNVRRGTGEDSDKIIADLVIYDTNLIREIENGKREVSCGYNCLYKIDDDGKIHQTAIRGNHVAVVEQGRAGQKVKIKDSKPETERGISFMSKKKDKSIVAKILGFAKDADPDEVAEVIETVTELQDNQVDENEVSDDTPADSTKDETATNEVLTKILLSMDELLKRVSDLESGTQNVAETDELSKLEDELSEESVTVPVEEIEHDSALEDEDTTEDATEFDGNTESETADEEIIKSKDSALALVRAMKPVVAKIKDPKEKRRATDALTKAVRDLYAKPKKQNVNGYQKIMDAKQTYAKKQVKDKNYVTVDVKEQQKIYDNLDPHKK